jgi:hypothetical protein
MTIQSFSGAHPYRPQCVIDVIANEWLEYGLDVTKRATEMAVTITVKIDAGTCPRCNGVLDLDMCAGSRATRCRCVPICGRCGSDEGNQTILGTGMSQAWRWPLRKGDITRRRNKVDAMGETVIALMVPGDGALSMLTEDGVSQVKMRPNPGGWLEFGYDDTEDQAERQQ